MTIGRPFQRAHIIASMLAMALAMPKGATRDIAISEVPTYRSRGKGRKNGGPMSTSNPVSRCNNAFDPPGTQGGREMSRRLSQKCFQNWLASQNNRAAVTG